MVNAISLFCGAGGMDVGFETAGIKVLWANEFNYDAVKTYRVNHPNTPVECADVRIAKETLKNHLTQGVDLVFGGPPCQGFSVAGKMDPNDERSTMIWEFFDVVKIVSPKMFVIENVKALGVLSRWETVRNGIYDRADELGYYCFSRVLNSSDFGVPQKRERVFFVGIKAAIKHQDIEGTFDAIIASKRKPCPNLRECLLKVGKAGTPENPITCTAKISLATNPVIRKSPYAGMLFNGMGRPMNLNELANTLPASMGGNKTPIIDELLLHDSSASDWIVDYHNMLLAGGTIESAITVPSYLRRLTIKEAAAIQTFPPEYLFYGEKSSIYRQIGNAVPCKLAQAVAETIVELDRQVLGIAV